MSTEEVQWLKAEIERLNGLLRSEKPKPTCPRCQGRGWYEDPKEPTTHYWCKDCRKQPHKNKTP